MSNDIPHPMCFVAMPFGKKPPPGKKTPLIDFDVIYKTIEQTVLDEKLECVRADFEASGGFIHRPMYERLLVAEYVIADLTLANPNVTYEVGVRHGCRAKATILICACDYVDQLPFDLKPLRVIIYRLTEEGLLEEAEAEKLRQSLGNRLKQAISGDLPPDNPILQVTAFGSTGDVHHQKTDVFLHRMRYASEIGERVHTALLNDDPTKAVAELKNIEDEVLGGPHVISQLNTALISLYIGYREKKAYHEMVALFDKLPEELQKTPVALEQLALALNRIAEQKIEEEKFTEANTLRNQALYNLDQISKKNWSSETYGIAGRIYKAKAEAMEKAGEKVQAKGALQRAIETYEQGFRLDPRDYYPGVNAVTLRSLRGSEEDLEMLATLVPAVRFSVNRAPTPEDENERYWQDATKLEIACADKDWKQANSDLIDVLSLDVKSWMRETTINNLKILKKAFTKDKTAVKSLEEIIDAMKPRSSG